MTNLCVAVNEHGETELSFTGADMAYRFAHDALEMSRIYVSDEDRYAMQMLSELLGQAIKKGVLSAEELYLTEETVIEKLMSDAETAKLWRSYCVLHEIVTDREAFPDGAWRVIGAKKRRIDPFVRGAGRLSEINAQFAGEIKDFMDTPLDRAICARTTTYDRAKAVADEIAELPHVTGVTFDDSTAHFVSSAALLTVSFDGDENERFPTEYDALIEALAKSIVEISSSSLTTIAGLVALMLMQFRLGYDLGLVLSKSIVCSLITVFLLMPGLIAYCRKPLRSSW